MSGLTCWCCGADADVIPVATMEGRSRVLVVSWSTSADDHQHTVKPPTAEDASSTGAAFLRTIGAASAASPVSAGTALVECAQDGGVPCRSADCPCRRAGGAR